MGAVGLLVGFPREDRDQPGVFTGNNVVQMTSFAGNLYTEVPFFVTAQTILLWKPPNLKWWISRKVCTRRYLFCHSSNYSIMKTGRIEMTSFAENLYTEVPFFSQLKLFYYENRPYWNDEFRGKFVHGGTFFFSQFWNNRFLFRGRLHCE